MLLTITRRKNAKEAKKTALNIVGSCTRQGSAWKRENLNKRNYESHWQDYESREDTFNGWLLRSLRDLTFKMRVHFSSFILSSFHGHYFVQRKAAATRYFLLHRKFGESTKVSVVSTAFESYTLGNGQVRWKCWASKIIFVEYYKTKSFFL